MIYQIRKNGDVYQYDITPEIAESIKTLKLDLRPLLDNNEPFNIELL